jgi:hypothetical protein
MSLEDWFDGMFDDLRGGDGPRRHLPDWPKALRAWVDAVVRSLGYVRPEADEVDATFADFAGLAGPLSALTLESLLEDYRALSNETDPRARSKRKDNLERATVLYRVLVSCDGPASRSWPEDWLHADESARDAARAHLGDDGLFNKEPDLFGRLAAVSQQALHPYSLMFPAVPDDRSARGHLYRARVSLLEARGSPGDKPRLALAPWSFFTRPAADMEKLEGSLERLAARPDGPFVFLKGCDMLLDLQPVEDCPDVLPPPSCEVSIEEGSLGLAVVTAAWASKQRPMFRRVVLTGRALHDKIGVVDDVRRKYETTRRYAGSRERECIFLAPAGAQGAEGLPRDEGYVRVIEVQDWGKYFAEQVPSLLGDGFEEYRAAPKGDRSTFRIARPSPPGVPAEDDVFGRYFEADVVELESAVVAALDHPPPRFSSVVLPFGNDPMIAARYSVGKLCETLRDGAGSGRLFAHETPIPVLLSLARRRPAKAWTPEDAVLRDLKSWLPRGVTRDQESFVIDAVRRFPDLFLLVVHGLASGHGGGYESDEEAVDRLDAWVDEAPSRTRPRVFFIASDEHHHRYLASRLRRLAGE